MESRLSSARSVIRMGVALLFIALCGCSSAPAPVPLPPLDSAPEVAQPFDMTEYRLRAGDTVRVKYHYHPELNMKVQIKPDGDITLPVAGLVHAANLTTGELEQAIVEKSKHRLREPEISVTVSQLGERKVYVLGEVRSPGFVAFREGMSPLQAIGERGGFTNVARLDSVLRLQQSSGARADYQGTRLDLSKPLATGVAEGVELAIGDVIYVPRSFIGDVNLFVHQYLRETLPIQPRIGAGTTF